MKLSKTYNLRVVNPGLAYQLHTVKNGDLTPEDVTPGSGKKGLVVMCKRPCMEGKCIFAR